MLFFVGENLTCSKTILGERAFTVLCGTIMAHKSPEKSTSFEKHLNSSELLETYFK